MKRLLPFAIPFVAIVAAGIGAFSGIAGLYASFYLNVASGAAVVLVAAPILGTGTLFLTGTITVIGPLRILRLPSRRRSM